ncbi:glycine betaine ABC transporter substrate-binding protein [Alteribacillus sp. YIM 98480]|uniref:glycine betaine ABC transporter substrate-binding protein n=1 Tax=Alteribacillus sp. YIM 98480 TaxID=2606599 RepID=UPI00131A9C2E|nr:glycine betaine ABC transporter substrate-binding protein [Alteribacillus sp. YIM 98480]
MKKIGISILAAMSITALAACGDSEEQEASGGNEGSPGSGETINIGVTPWSSTVPPTEVAALILEDMGYEVERTEADVGGVFTGLSRGDLDVFMDGWFPMHKNYIEQFGDSIDETAVSYPEAEIGWVVPSYMEEIDSMEDLKGNEDKFDNEMYSIEEGAEATETSREMTEGYDLDMEVVASSEGGMLAEASRKIQNEEPVVFYGWRPHPMFNDYDLKVLEDPQEFFETSEVRVITNSNLQEEAPEAYEFLSNWSINIEDVEKMIVEIDENERGPEEVAQEWVDDHQDEIEEMKND